MPLHRPQKKRVDQIDRRNLTEPELSRDEKLLFDEGISLFNRGEFWRAHEAWEGVWHRRTEESRLFYQGLIQAAAGYHLAIERPRISGALRNFEKSLEKLELFPRWFLGIDVAALMTTMRAAAELLRSKGVTERGFPENFIPILAVRGGLSRPGESRVP